MWKEACRTVRLVGSLTSWQRCYFCDSSKDGSQCPICSRRIDAFLRDVEHLYERYVHGLTAHFVPPYWCNGAIGTVKNYLMHSYAFVTTHNASFLGWRLAWQLEYVESVTSCSWCWQNIRKYVKNQGVKKDSWCKVYMALLVAVANECCPRHEIIENK